MKLNKIKFREVPVGEGFNVGHFESEVVVGDEEPRGSDLPRNYLLLVELYDHLYESSTNFENVFLLQLSSNDIF